MTSERDGYQTRQEILAVVQETGAIHKSELCRRVEKAWGTIAYHIRVLHREGMVASERHGGLHWVFPAGFDAQERRKARALAEESARQVLQAVEESPGLTPVQLGNALDLPMKTIRRHLSDLTDSSVIQRFGARPQRFQVIRSAWRRS